MISNVFVQFASQEQSLFKSAVVSLKVGEKGLLEACMKLAIQQSASKVAVVSKIQLKSFAI
jgi:hypothetical protein